MELANIPPCRERSNGTTKDYSPGKAGNRILVVLQSPGKAEVDLQRPATGHTGANICRLFSFMKNGCKQGNRFYEQEFCIRNVTIVNSTCADFGEIDLTGKQIIFCFGERARNWYRRKKGTLSKKHLALSFCHIGSRGLCRIRTSAGAKVDEGVVIRKFANWVDKKYDKFCKGARDGVTVCSLNEFLRYANFKWGFKTAEG